jgi:hypothetical protein
MLISSPGVGTNNVIHYTYPEFFHLYLKPDEHPGFPILILGRNDLI